MEKVFFKFILCFILCSSQTKAMGVLSPLDPSSYSRPELAAIKHISLALDVDFEKKVLHGEATLNFDVLAEINDLILDASNLKIDSIHLKEGPQLQYTLGDHVPNFGSKLTVTLPEKLNKGAQKYETTTKETSCVSDGPIYPRGVINSNVNAGKDTLLKEHNTVFRTVSSREQIDTCHCMLNVGEVPSFEYLYKLGENISNENADNNLNEKPVCKELPLCQTSCYEIEGYGQTSSTCPKSSISITIKYSTDPSASALQWLSAAQTSGKKYPYMFSQCQPIHARSILPCQDTPAVKFTYDAVVTAPAEFTVLMSALRGNVRSNKTTYSQPMPLPSYLVAIAVGVLESRPLGPRSKVWSEKEEIERSAWEFAETEKYLQAAEKLCGPYEWSEYDLLVLPPSFPYGGMENPCLTFVTPTLLAGDRSQASVIVHEIMHSWTGNLVTNRNFEHFWLNEGFTVFLERKVASSLINDTVAAKQDRDFQSLLGLQELRQTINQLGVSDPLTNLVVNLESVHPDDAFSRVPYEKGSLFLRYLEDLTGGSEVFDDFLRSYLREFSKKSLDTNQFKSYLLEYFKDNNELKKLDWNLWLNTPGMPPVIPEYDTTMTKEVNLLVNKLDAKDVVFSAADVATFTPHQMIHYLQQLIDRLPLPIEQLHSMGTEYSVDGNKNTEILFRWLRLCVKSKDQSKLSDVFTFLNGNGRMKYVRPLYRDLYSWEEVRDRAIANFLENEKNMMHVCAYTLRKDLHLSD